MPLTRGSQLGHYEIGESIGEGGMGIVYRAHDGKLGRDVAIKVLPDELSRDVDRLARFQREAKLLAALNHPNIAAIYGLEESEGTHYLVLELIDGESLAERIRRGPLPLDEARAIAIEIAGALEQAHERGIVHRDLKPANVMMTREGGVKVLDFGLAKALAAMDDAPEVSSSRSPTLTRGTALGTIMGTAAYMSPEQAKGKAVDRRCDVWAFGCCLYEMLSGRRAFEGDDVTETLASVLRDEPAWSRLPALPASIRQLLERCLRKDASRRVQHLGDVRLALQEAHDEPVDAPPRAARLAPVVVGGLVGALAAALGTLMLTRSEPPAVRTLSILIPEDQQLEVQSGFPRPTVAIAPDGNTIAYVGRAGSVARLYLRALDDSAVREVPDSNGAAMPFFSPDSAWVGFEGDGVLKKAPVNGGPTVDIAEVGFATATWFDDDTILFSSDGELSRIPSSGGDREPTGVHQALFPNILPGGGAFVYESIESNLVQHAYFQPMSGGEPRRLIENASRPVYVESGHLLFSRSGVLMAVKFDPEAGRVLGSPTPVVEHLRPHSYSVSRDGTLVHLPGESSGDEKRSLVWVDREGTVERATSIERRFIRGARLSPSGRRIAVTIFPDVWVLDPDRDALNRLTFGEGFSRDPVWSPDGTRLFLAAERGGDHFIMSASADASGDDVVHAATESGNRPSISSDGTVVVFDDDGDVAMIRAVDSAGEVTTLLDSEFHESSPALSPDDRWLAYTSNESGRDEIYVRSFPALDQKRPVSTNGGANPVWSRDGTELFFRENNKLMAVDVVPGSEFRAGRPLLVFEDPARLEAEFDVDESGERFLMIQHDAAGAREIRVVLNFTETLKRLAPR